MKRELLGNLELLLKIFKNTQYVKGCWEYVGNKDSYGYGQMRITLSDGKNNKRLVHRIVYQCFNGKTKLCVLHRCDNRSCINPSHLFAGTQAENVKDMIFKKRNVIVRGEKRSQSKLKDSDVLKIKALINEGVLFKDIAAKFKVSSGLIGHINRGRIWKHLK